MLGLGLLVVVPAACGGGDAAPEAGDAAPPGRTTNVHVFRADPDTLTLISRLPATVRAQRRATLSFQEPGTLSLVLADLGDQVRRGELLARLDTDVLEAAAVEAEAGLKFQTYNHERARQLHAEGTISEQDYYAAEYAWKSATAAARTVRARLENSELRAPFGGTVARRSAEAGDVVTPGTPVYDLVQADTVKVEVWVPETDIVDFAVGRPVSVRVDAFPDRSFEGEVGRIGPSADTDRRVFPLEVFLANDDGALRPGMIGRVEVVRRTYHDVLVIPREAVLQRDEGSTGFVEAGGTVSARRLTLGPSEGNRVVVLSGLSAGDRVVVAGGRDLIEGEKVTVTESPSGASR
jgi:membrane fusion protein (multidrug efflux system)